jgi:hypothetical protein
MSGGSDEFRQTLSASGAVTYGRKVMLRDIRADGVRLLPAKIGRSHASLIGRSGVTFAPGMAIGLSKHENPFIGRSEPPLAIDQGSSATRSWIADIVAKVVVFGSCTSKKSGEEIEERAPVFHSDIHRSHSSCHSKLAGRSGHGSCD